MKGWPAIRPGRALAILAAAAAVLAAACGGDDTVSTADHMAGGG